jgi:hypothetical protein
MKESQHNKETNALHFLESLSYDLIFASILVCALPSRLNINQTRGTCGCGISPGGGGFKTSSAGGVVAQCWFKNRTRPG